MPGGNNKKICIDDMHTVEDHDEYNSQEKIVIVSSHMVRHPFFLSCNATASSFGLSSLSPRATLRSASVLSCCRLSVIHALAPHYIFRKPPPLLLLTRIVKVSYRPPKSIKKILRRSTSVNVWFFFGDQKQNSRKERGSFVLHLLVQDVQRKQKKRGRRGRTDRNA